MKNCKHETFQSQVTIQRFIDIGRFCAEIHIRCSQCYQPFQFHGLNLGLHLDGATMSIDGQEARLAISPVGSELPPLKEGQAIGFIIKKSETEQRIKSLEIELSDLRTELKYDNVM